MCGVKWAVMAGVFTVVVVMLMGVECVIRSGAAWAEIVVSGCQVEDVA